MTTTNALPLDGERLLQIARDTGLRHHLHGVAPDAARVLLTRFAEAVMKGTPAAAVADAQPVDWKALDARIDEFVGEYEMCGEDEAGRDGCYTPTEGERAMISDAIHGLLAEDEVIQMLRPAAQPSAQAQPSGNSGELQRDAERYRFAMDWQTSGFAVCMLIEDAEGWAPILNNGPIDAAIAASKGAKP